MHSLPAFQQLVPRLLGFCKGFCKLKDPMNVRYFLARVKQDSAGALYRMDDAWMGNTFLLYSCPIANHGGYLTMVLTIHMHFEYLVNHQVPCL